MWCSSTATPEPSPTGWPPLETSTDTTDGLTSAEQLAALGNGVLPAQAVRALRALGAAEADGTT